MRSKRGMPHIGRPKAEVVVTDDERVALVRLTKRAGVRRSAQRAAGFLAVAGLHCHATSLTAW